MASAPTIFVQIASYRDPECQWTVWDLFSKAAHPERITAGICWQYDPYRDRDCFAASSPRPGQTKIISVLPSQTEGVCWARAQAQTLFADQDYVLMIDSHMRFVKGWDTALIAELGRCDSKKPFLSNYPPGYKPPDDLEPRPQFVVLRAKPFNEAGDIRFDGERMAEFPDKPLRGAFLAAGYLFAPGRFIREVPYDPYIYFDHEEVMLAARAYTKGWDVYSPSKTFIYHYYLDQKKGEKRALHWADEKDWRKFLERSRARYNYLLAGTAPANRDDLVDIGAYGLGDQRTLKEYEDFCGLDFKNKTASEKALKALFIENLERCRKPEGTKPGLREGDRLPPLEIRDAAGHRQDITALLADTAAVICILPGAFEDYTREFMARYKAKAGVFHESGVRIVFIAPIFSGRLAAFRRKFDVPQEIMADESRALCMAFGMEASAHDSPLSCGVDSGGKITAVYRNRNAENHMNDILREAGKLGAPAEDIRASGKIK
jgi:peroxiredoxin